MGLKLTVTPGDKIVVGDNVVIDIRTTSDRQTQLEFHAPMEVAINAIFLDSSKQFKNKRGGK